MEFANLLRLRLQKYSPCLNKQVLNSNFTKQDFNRNLPKANKYNIPAAGMLHGNLAV